MTRKELENILSKKGFNLQKIGNLYQVKSRSLKTIYQSHDIDDISALAELTELRILILGDNEIRDISALGQMPHLQYVELFTNRITDISPLANCKELLDLNLTHNQITDITPLMSCMSLERVWASHNQFDEEGVNAFKETHPACILDLTNVHPTADDWRHHPRYDQYLKMFKTKTWVPFE